MKRGNDYLQNHDAFKKPRVNQGYSTYPSHGGMGSASNDNMYGGGGYANAQMMMGAYGQAGGAQYPDHQMAVQAPYGAPFPPQNFGTPYGANQFQLPFQGGGVGPTGGPSGRTVYVGNVPAEATVEEILNLVRTGVVESARILPEKNCAFISFIDGVAASNFHQDANVKKFTLGGQELKVGWGKASVVPANILAAAQQGATRNVFLGKVDATVTETALRTEFSPFGVIDTIKILREKNIAFIHFSSIASAMKAVQTLSHDPQYLGRRVNYGKDRCAKSNAMPPAFGFGAAQGFTQYGGQAPVPFAPNFDRFPGTQRGNGPSGNFSSPMPLSTLTANGNRTVYLGNISPETTCEDICNVIRGGILNNIRYLANKHIAFVSFVDPVAATNFFNHATYQGVMVKARRLKVGWGQSTHPLPQAVIQAVQHGATRNVYLGNLPDTMSEEKMREDFTEFGEIELINILKEKNCGFVNFTNILSAVKAIEGIKMRPEYSQININYGKDRCGNQPKPPKSGQNNMVGVEGTNGGSGTNHSSDGGVVMKSEDTPADIQDFDDDDALFLM